MVGKAVSGDVTGATNKTLLAIFATASRYPKLRRVIIGCSGTPADNASKFAIGLITATGSGATVTTQAADQMGGGPSCEVRANYTSEPTYATGYWTEFGMHQKATIDLKWEGDERPTTNLSPGTVKGIGIRMISGPAVAFNVSAEWDE